MTKYKCYFCGKEETWGNTVVPNICKGCSDEMAKRIILSGRELLK